jgi:precorrin-2 methylase
MAVVAHRFLDASIVRFKTAALAGGQGCAAAIETLPVYAGEARISIGAAEGRELSLERAAAFDAAVHIDVATGVNHARRLKLPRSGGSLARRDAGREESLLAATMPA